MKQKEIIIKSIKTPKARNEIFHYNFRFRLLDSKKAATSETTVLSVLVRCSIGTLNSFQPEIRIKKKKC